jgi:hypothetical protein
MQLTLSHDHQVVGARVPHGSAYYDPVGVATQLTLAGQPWPVDLEADLEAMGYMIDEFKLSIINEQHNAGFHLV